jgi:dephospho-CoA kinase
MNLVADVQGVIGPQVEDQVPNHFKFIGITGGIGSGKSFICKIFQSLGIPVYDADSRAKWLIVHDEALKESIKNLLGSAAYTASGAYDTSYVSSLVFNDEALLNQLNALVHPVVQTDSIQWYEEVKRSGRFPYAIKEAAIMTKASEHNNLDAVVQVTASESIRIDRVLKRDRRRTEADIRAIIERQMPENERLQFSDFVVYNDQKKALLPQLLVLHKLFSGLS